MSLWHTRKPKAAPETNTSPANGSQQQQDSEDKKQTLFERLYFIARQMYSNIYILTTSEIEAITLTIGSRFIKFATTGLLPLTTIGLFVVVILSIASLEWFGSRPFPEIDETVQLFYSYAKSAPFQWPILSMLIAFASPIIWWIARVKVAEEIGKSLGLTKTRLQEIVGSQLLVSRDNSAATVSKFGAKEVMMVTFFLLGGAWILPFAQNDVDFLVFTVRYISIPLLAIGSLMLLVAAAQQGLRAYKDSHRTCCREEFITDILTAILTTELDQRLGQSHKTNMSLKKMLSDLSLSTRRLEGFELTRAQRGDGSFQSTISVLELSLHMYAVWLETPYKSTLTDIRDRLIRIFNLFASNTTAEFSEDISGMAGKAGIRQPTPWKLIWLSLPYLLVPGIAIVALWNVGSEIDSQVLGIIVTAVYAWLVAGALLIVSKFAPKSVSQATAVINQLLGK